MTACSSSAVYSEEDGDFASLQFVSIAACKPFVLKNANKVLNVLREFITVLRVYGCLERIAYETSQRFGHSGESFERI
jgi:hypothetical protein